MVLGSPPLPLLQGALLRVSSAPTIWPATPMKSLSWANLERKVPRQTAPKVGFRPPGPWTVVSPMGPRGGPGGLSLGVGSARAVLFGSGASYEAKDEYSRGDFEGLPFPKILAMSKRLQKGCDR
jgi:hypothetical protein